MGRTIKHPAAAAGAHDPAKKPATWCEYVDASDADEDEAPLADGNDAASTHDVDTRAVTPAQRHVFKKALGALPGLPGSLPDEVREQFDKASKPAEKAAVINAVVPRDVKYKDQFDVSTMNFEKFAKAFRSKTSAHETMGSTRSELEMKWGHGDWKKGSEAIDRALAKKELILQNGLLYSRSHKVVVAAHEEQGVRGSGSASTHDYAEQQSSIEGEIDEWVKFSIASEPSKNLGALRKAPPSSMAEQYVEEARRKCNDACSAVKTLGSQLKALALPQHQRTYMSSLQRALQLSREVHDEFLTQFDDMCTMGMDEKSDMDIKNLLLELKPKYEELQSLAANLRAIYNAVKPKLR